MQPASRRAFIQQATAFVAGALVARTEAAERGAIVDCHTHFYDPSRPEGVPWPAKDDAVLYRTVLPRNFLEQAAPLGVTQTVVVEASPRVEDNAWLLELAAANPAVVGVVGNLAPGTPQFAGLLKRFAANRRFRGIRINHDVLRTGLERPPFVADIGLIADLGLELDVNGGPETPADAARLAKKLPALTIVINHLANVDIAGGPPPENWLANMRAAAEHANMFCKVSALVEHARPNAAGRIPAEVDYYRPTLDAIWQAFGDDRLIYGSNWPVSDRFAPYRTVFAIVSDYVRGRGGAAAEKFFRSNARAVYRWPN